MNEKWMAWITFEEFCYVYNGFIKLFGAIIKKPKKKNINVKSTGFAEKSN